MLEVNSLDMKFISIEFANYWEDPIIKAVIQIDFLLNVVYKASRDNYITDAQYFSHELIFIH